MDVPQINQEYKTVVDKYKKKHVVLHELIGVSPLDNILKNENFVLNNIIKDFEKKSKPDNSKQKMVFQNWIKKDDKKFDKLNRILDKPDSY